MTIDEWLECCALIGELWPHKPMPPSSAETWYELLADLDGRTVATAIRTYATGPDATWPPSLGQIRQAAQPPRRPWSDALADMSATICRVGAYQRPPDFGDAAIDAYIASAGGWQTLCATFNSNDPTVRAQFRDAYTAAQNYQADHDRRELAAGNVATALGLPHPDQRGQGPASVGELLGGGNG